MINKLKELRETGSEEGFTLIELMIVVVIIGILAAIAIPIFMNQQKAAIQAGVKSDVKNTVTNVATYLVKKPTAGTADLAASKTGNGTQTGTNFAIVASDAATTVETSGTWDGYTVVGTNTEAGATSGTDYVVTYSSTSGKTVIAGD